MLKVGRRVGRGAILTTVGVGLVGREGSQLLVIDLEKFLNLADFAPIPFPVGLKSSLHVLSILLLLPFPAFNDFLLLLAFPDVDEKGLDGAAVKGGFDEDAAGLLVRIINFIMVIFILECFIILGGPIVVGLRC
jgi:hypothetical protein